MQTSIIKLSISTVLSPIPLTDGHVCVLNSLTVLYLTVTSKKSTHPIIV